MPAKKDPRLARAGVTGYNKPKRVHFYVPISATNVHLNVHYSIHCTLYET